MRKYNMTDAEMIEEINELRRKHNAIILAHNYQLGSIQDIADFCGDSLELSIKAADTDADMIVFCGVSFMAETAKILSPEKTVLLPVATAGCDMADMITGESLKEFKKNFNNPITVCYVNTTADVKAECDISVTSANALEIIKMLPEDREILFVPDYNLGVNCMNASGRKMTMWKGCCPIHQRITPEMVEKRREEYPNAVVLMHPEAPAETVALADEVLSTGGILRYVKNSKERDFIIATEIGIIHRLEKENPDKRFIPISVQAVCQHMKVIELEDVMNSLRHMRTVIEIPEELRKRAELPIRRMLNKSFDFK